MRFRFSLENVLRFRASMEKREWLALQAIGQKIQNIRKDLKRIDEDRKTNRERREQELRAGTTGSTLHFLSSCDEHVNVRRERLVNTFEKLQQDFRNQQQQFLEQRYKHEALQQLRAQQLERFLRDLARCEQELADEMFLMRRELLRARVAQSARQTLPSSQETSISSESADS
jgi:flagellar export protein FliJ